MTLFHSIYHQHVLSWNITTKSSMIHIQQHPFIANISYVKVWKLNACISWITLFAIFVCYPKNAFDISVASRAACCFLASRWSIPFHCHMSHRSHDTFIVVLTSSGLKHVFFLLKLFRSSCGSFHTKSTMNKSSCYHIGGHRSLWYWLTLCSYQTLSMYAHGDSFPLSPLLTWCEFNSTRIGSYLGCGVINIINICTFRYRHGLA